MSRKTSYATGRGDPARVRLRMEALDDRCLLSHGVESTFGLTVGKSAFWNGPYVERAVEVADFVGNTALGQDSPVESSQHWDYKIDVREAGGHRLRVALDVILGGFRGSADHLALYDPGGTFRLEVFDPNGNLALQDRDGVRGQGDGRADEPRVGAATTTFKYSAEVFVAAPRPGTYTVRVTPVDVADRAFRMRARLEPPPTAGEVRALLPNLRVAPPFEPTFATPTVTYGPGTHVPGVPDSSRMADEVLDPEDGRPPSGMALRFSAGIENAGRGPLLIQLEPLDASNSWVTSPVPVRQEVLWSDGTRQAVGDYGSAGEAALHATHLHFHYQGIYTYGLWRVTDPGSGAMEQVGDGHKLGFSPGDERMVDWHRFYHEVPGTYHRTTPFQLSSGWSDLYEWNRSGQYVDIPVNPDGTPVAGDYVIRGTADADGNLVESNERDNVSYAYVRVENTPTGPRVTVLERGYGTDPWDHKKVVDGPFGSPSDPDDVIVGPVTVEDGDLPAGAGSTGGALVAIDGPSFDPATLSLFWLPAAEDTSEKDAYTPPEEPDVSGDLGLVEAAGAAEPPLLLAEGGDAGTAPAGEFLTGLMGPDIL